MRQLNGYAALEGGAGEPVVHWPAARKIDGAAGRVDDIATQT